MENNEKTFIIPSESDIFYATDTSVLASDKDYCIVFGISIPPQIQAGTAAQGMQVHKKYIYLSRKQAEDLSNQLAKTIEMINKLATEGKGIESIASEKEGK